MTDKINGYGQGISVVGGSRSAAVSRTDSAGTAGKSQARQTGADTLTLTDSGRTLARLAEAVAASPETDGLRVDSLKAAIAGGTYQVDASRVASRLMAADRDFAAR
ncbi:MAG: Anti-sigma-28 factor, FlgM [Pseudomonadota bacterium]|jgi:negative regulator of flagellin synthesis FlgM